MVKNPLCVVLFLIGLVLIAMWWLAKMRARPGFVRGRPPEWLLFLGITLVSGTVWWGFS